jgi:hypothetical protein
MTTADPDFIHLATPHPEDGRALRYHLDEFVASWIPRMAEGLRNHRYIELAARHLDRDLLQMYLEQCLYIELLDVARALVRRRYLALTGRAFDKPVTCPSELFDLVSEHWPEKTVRLRKERLIHIRRRLAPIWHSVRNRLWRSRFRSYVPNFRQPMVGVELVEGSDLASKCDAFWLANRTVDPKRVLFVLEPLNSVFFDAAVEFDSIRNLGANMVALHPSVSLDGKIPLWFPDREPVWVFELKSSLQRPAGGMERWLARVIRHCANRAGYWEEFFRAHNVVIFQQLTELTVETAIKRMALNRLGGVETGKMRSQFFEPSSAAFHFQHEAAFVWHANVAPCLETGRTRTRIMVETGYVYEALLRSDSNVSESRRIREHFRASGVSLVLAVYDNHPHLNGHFDQSQLKDFYSYLIDLARTNGDIGLIIKSKKPQILQQLPDIRAQIDTLKQSGKCVVLEGRMTSVSVSALAADIAIGFPASTAACEAALAGCKIIMWDPGNAKGHALAGSEQKLIYTDFPQFQVALENLIVAQRGQTNPTENGEAMISRIDRFHDGLSYRRAADFIRIFLEAKERGLDKLESLNEILRQLDYCYSVPECTRYLHDAARPSRSSSAT